MEFIKLYFSFAKIGFTSFGGISMLSVIFDEVITNGWMNEAEITDLVAIAEMTPGPLGLNCATFAGIRAAGPIGAVSAVLGILTPTFTLCALAAYFLHHFKDNKLLQRFLTGVRPAALGLMMGVAVTLFKTSYLPAGVIDWPVLFIGLLATIALFKWRPSIPKVIMSAAAVGLLIIR